MSREKKINKTPVWQYMNVVNNPNQYASSKPDSLEYAILKKFKYCALSHTTREKDRKSQNLEQLWPDNAWNVFNMMMIAFQYLNADRADYTNAVKLENLFDLYADDKELNPHGKQINGWNAELFLFGMDETTKHALFAKPEADTDESYFNEILGEDLNKNSTVEDVIRRLWQYVRADAQKKYAFQQIAVRGFDIGSSHQISVAEFDVGSPIQRSCAMLYKAGARQIVFTGAPGTGKTYTAYQFAKRVVEGYFENRNHLKTHIEIVQFHSSYDYSDFVEGLRPVETGENNEVTFRRLDGQFKAFCRKILKDIDCNAPYFFIIDEINRADLSRVFGELMFCLDESKRPVSLLDTAGKMVTTQYSNLPTYEVSKETGKAAPIPEDVYRDGFCIPRNLCILATMNDIDRSIETFDFALRRRFKWIEAKANDEMECGLRGMLGSKIPGDLIQDLTKKAKKLNDVIAGTSNSRGESLRLTTAYHIGHAYFEKFNGENLQDIWDTQIEQILREYCRGRSNASQVEEFINYCHDALFGNTTEN